MRQAVAALCIVLLGAGALRSISRGPVWKDNGTLFRQTVNDVPLSYRAHWMLAEYLLKDGPNANGLDEMLLAVGLARKNDSYVLAFAGDRFREAGKCGPALGMYHRALGIRPEASDARIGAAACLVTQGRIREAQNVALDVLRRTRPTSELVEVAADDTRPAYAELAELTDGLGPKEQAAVVLRYGYDLSYEQIASALGSSPDAARQATSTGVRRIRRRITS